MNLICFYVKCGNKSNCSHCNTTQSKSYFSAFQMLLRSVYVHPSIAFVASRFIGCCLFTFQLSLFVCLSVHLRLFCWLVIHGFQFLCRFGLLRQPEAHAFIPIHDSFSSSRRNVYITMYFCIFHETTLLSFS